MRIRLLLLLLALLAPSAVQAQPSVFICLGPPSIGACTPVSASNPMPITGTISATTTGFHEESVQTPITATTGGVSSAAFTAGKVVVVTNAGTTNIAYCQLGAAATTSGQPIAPNGGWFAFTSTSETLVTCATSTSTTTVNFAVGTGLPTGTGGGGGSAGGGGAITIPSGAVASGAYSSGSIASGALAVGAGADGWDVGVGPTTATAATAGSTGSVNAKLRLMTTQLDTISTAVQGAVPAGTNGIGSLTAGTAIIGKVGFDQTTPGTTNAIRTIAGATGGGTLSSAIAPATPAGVNLKASAGTVFKVFATTIQATPVYIKFYNASSAPTCGSGTPIGRFMVPVASTAANGAGNNIDIGDIGAAFGTGIGYCVTGALADNDTTAITANNTLVNIVWN